MKWGFGGGGAGDDARFTLFMNGSRTKGLTWNSRILWFSSTGSCEM